jgi:hypothetical protein
VSDAPAARQRVDADDRDWRPRADGPAPARIPTLVAWSALCGICGGVGETLRHSAL